ncbi:uncharacterized protein V1510DRAFT_422546 [Dipodascopsis tothii]|uniref:uncharacterized protein n=1 Tax=Dipodascopsis tothii TaxID=44089 RepID=UPI0034CEED81
MAAASAGVAYAVYAVARKYVVPLIVPPAGPQFDADRAALEAEFDRVAALVEQVRTDAAEARASEQRRAAAVDAAVGDLAAVTAELRSRLEHRDADLQAVRGDVDELRVSLPRWLEKAGSLQTDALTEIQNEVASLRQLMVSRLRAAGAQPDEGDRAASPGPRPPFASTSTFRVPNRPGSRVSIPAWQLAATARTEDARPATETEAGPA